MPSPIKRAQDGTSKAISAAQQGRIVTFGIVPTRAETGFGYLKVGAALEGTEAFQVDRFIEKPDRHTAEGFLASGNHLWNGGLFLFRADVFLSELGRLEPQMMADATESYARGRADMDFVRLDREIFSRCRSDLLRHGCRASLSQTWVELGFNRLQNQGF